LGFDGIYLDVKKLDYAFHDSTTAIIHSIDATLDHAVDASGNFSGGSLFAIRGLGASTTLGVTYIRHHNRAAYDCNNFSDRNKKYQYRLGASLIDLGYIRFVNEAKVTSLNTSMDRVWNGIDSTKFGSFNNFDAMLDNQLNGGAGRTGNSAFTMLLPAALSIQFDYCLAKRWYANATVVNRLHFMTNEMARNNQLDFSLRYERKQFELSTNVSLYEYQDISAGVSMRYLFFVVGTDRALEWLGQTDVKSFDIFFGIKTNLCQLPGKKVKRVCPTFKTAG